MKISEFSSYASKTAFDRRSSERTRMLYRPLLLEIDDFAGFCLLRNLSESGMMGVVYTPFAAGQSATVHFLPNVRVSGEVAWSEEDRIGIRFHEQIDLEHMLVSLGGLGAEGVTNRSPRLEISCPGTLRFSDQTLKMQLRNISQRGIKAAVGSLSPGNEVAVFLDGLPQRKAVVRWAQEDLAGLNFFQPLGFEELAVWAIRTRSR